jgi:hypothetical protein
VREHLLPVADQMLAEMNRRIDVPNQFLQILAVQIKQIERVIFEAVLAARRELGLQLGKIGSPIMDNHDLAVDDRLARNIQPAGEARETLGPVQTAAREGARPAVPEMKLNSVTVVFDLVQPSITRGRLGRKGCELRLDEAGHRNLHTLGHTRLQIRYYR